MLVAYVTRVDGVRVYLQVWHYMAKLMTLSAAKHDKSEKSDHALKFRMSNKHPDLLPLLKGAWLVRHSSIETCVSCTRCVLDKAIANFSEQTPFLSIISRSHDTSMGMEELCVAVLRRRNGNGRQGEQNNTSLFNRAKFDCQF